MLNALLCLLFFPFNTFIDILTSWECFTTFVMVARANVQLAIITKREFEWYNYVQLQAWCDIYNSRYCPFFVWGNKTTETARKIFFDSGSTFYYLAMQITVHAELDLFLFVQDDAYNHLYTIHQNSFDITTSRFTNDDYENLQ